MGWARTTRRSCPRCAGRKGRAIGLQRPCQRAQQLLRPRPLPTGVDSRAFRSAGSASPMSPCRLMLSMHLPACPRPCLPTPQNYTYIASSYIRCVRCTKPPSPGRGASSSGGPVVGVTLPLFPLALHTGLPCPHAAHPLLRRSTPSPVPCTHTGRSFLQGGGARVVPVLADMPPAEVGGACGACPLAPARPVAARSCCGRPHAAASTHAAALQLQRQRQHAAPCTPSSPPPAFISPLPASGCVCPPASDTPCCMLHPPPSACVGCRPSACSGS